MNPVISPGDRVSVKRYVNSYYRGNYLAEVLNWTKDGRLRVRTAQTKLVRIVSADNVKKLADGPKKEE